MTLLKDRLKMAGVKTAQARLAVLAFESLRETRNIAAAATALLKKIDPAIVTEVFLVPYLLERQADMRGGETAPDIPPAPQVDNYHERRAVRRQRNHNVDIVVRKAVEVIRFNHLTSDGRDWAAVGAHELLGMDRDGRLAREVELHLGTLSNSQRFLPIGRLISPETFKRIVRSLAAGDSA